MKKLFVVIISIFMIFSTAVVLGCSKIKVKAESVGEEYTALDYSSVSKTVLSMPEVFKSGMMFCSDKPINVWGVGKAGSSAQIILEDGVKIVETKTVEIGEDGIFKESLSSLTASFTEYKLTVTDGVTNLVYTDILVGELYLSCGQSNMALNVQYSSNGEEIMSNADNDKIRFYMAPTKPSGANNAFPYKPQYYIPGGTWAKGNSAIMVAGCSAVTYNFALELYKELNSSGKNVPVGFLDTALGATSIEAWVSRNGIMANKGMAEYLDSKGRLIGEDKWNTSTTNNYNQITALFNSKIAPVTNMNIKGIIWYQGENNVGNEVAGEYYKNALNALMKDWSIWFRSNDKNLPFVFAHMTPHNYGYEPSALAYMWEGMAKAQKLNSQTCTQVTTYDVPLDWFNPNFAYRSPIHPIVKKPIGIRMAKAMLGLVYGDAKEFNPPTYNSMMVSGKKLTVKLDNTGEGLKSRDGNEIKGFAICGKDRIFYPASAEIIDKNTIVLTSENVNNPQAATFAFSTMVMSANLVNSSELSCVPFRTDEIKSTYYHPKDWQSCDNLERFISHGSGTAEELAGFVDTFKHSQNASLSLTEGLEGKGLKLEYTLFGRGTASVSPILNYPAVFEQFADYGSISFNVLNSESRDKQIKEVKVTLADNSVGSLMLCDSDEIGITLAKNSTLYTHVRYDLTKMKTSAGIVDISVKRVGIKDLEFIFQDISTGFIIIDSFSLGKDDLVPPTLDFNVSGNLNENIKIDVTVLDNKTLKEDIKLDITILNAATGEQVKYTDNYKITNEGKYIVTVTAFDNSENEITAVREIDVKKSKKKGCGSSANLILIFSVLCLGILKFKR